MHVSQGTLRNSRFDRRNLLRAAGAGLTGVAALGVVGCGDDDDDAEGSPTAASGTAPASATAEPKRGGTWNRGAGGNISLASLPFQEAGTLSGGGNAAAAGLGLVWGQLVRMSETKLEWEPDHAKEWQVAADG
jgi:hypothetical protein